MSSAANMYIGTNERVAYEIEHRGNCVLISGTVPASAFGVLTKLVPPNSVMNNDVARMYGVKFAFGLPDDLQALRDARVESEVQRQRLDNPNLSPGAQRWLAAGERGASSEALFTRLSGVNATRGAIDGVARADHPYDPDDFRRCRLMLEACPELGSNIASGWTPEWDALFFNWEKICATMDAETPNWRIPTNCQSAPKTYKLIQQAIGR